MWSPATQHARGERRPRGNSTLPVSQHLSANVELHILRRSRLRAAESRRSRGAVHVAGRALRAALGDGDPATWCSASGTGSSTTRWPPPRRSTAWYTTRWCLSSTCRAIERTRCDRRHRHRLHRRRLVDGHGVRCCRGATDPLLPETCVVQDIGELAVLPAFRWRPKAPAAFRQSSRRCGAEDSRAAERQRPSGRGPRARAPPPGSSGATTATDRPHGRRVRQTSLPRHSSCRSTERPFRFVVVDHTVRPNPAVPSREGTPPGHDQHRRPARNPTGRPDQTRPSLRSEHYLAHAVADQRARVHRCRRACRAAFVNARGQRSGNSTESGGTRCRNRSPGPRPRSCSSGSAIWICRYWRLSI